MLNISQIQNFQGYAQDFLTHYLTGGFGGMQKRDLDTLVFGLLLKYGAFGGSANAPEKELFISKPEAFFSSLIHRNFIISALQKIGMIPATK